MPERLSAVGATTPRTESAASPLPAEAPGKPSPCLESHARLAASSAAFMRTKVRVGAAAAGCGCSLEWAGTRPADDIARANIWPEREVIKLRSSGYLCPSTALHAKRIQRALALSLAFSGFELAFDVI